MGLEERDRHAIGPVAMGGSAEVANDDVEGRDKCEVWWGQWAGLWVVP